MATHSSCSCLGNPRDGGAWWAAVCGVTQSRTRLKWLSSSSSIYISLLLSQFITPSPSPNLSTEIDFYNHPIWSCGFPDGSMVKNPSANTGNVGLIPGLGRSPGEGNGNPLQYSCWGNLMDRGAWQAAVHGVTEELDTTQWLNNNNLEQQSEHCAKWKRSLNLKTCESRSLWCILGWSLGNASANLLNESGKCPD